MASTFIRVNAINIEGAERFSFSVDGNPAKLELLNSAPDKPPLDDFNRMVSDPEQDTPLVTTAGDALHADLMQHKNWQNALDTTLGAAAARDRRIHVEIPGVARSAHNYPWEVLHYGAGFPATNPGISFLRIVPPHPDSARPGAVYEGTLKLMAVIAAAGVDGKAEWAALRAALKRWKHPISCRILVDRPALRDQIVAEGIAGLECDLVRTDGQGPTLFGHLDDFLPHVVHLFCHGQVDQSPRLEIATNKTAGGDPPLFVSAAELAPHLGTAWLVTLNACSSGEVNADANTNSIASELVERGIPFVTSMRQEVPVQVANCFTRAFYESWLKQLSADVKAGNAFELSVDDALFSARNAIVQKYGGGAKVEARIKEWSLPIVCAGSTRFEIKLPTPQSNLSEQNLVETVAQIAQLRGALAAGGWSDQERAIIEQQIAALQKRLGGGA